MRPLYFSSILHYCVTHCAKGLCQRCHHRRLSVSQNNELNITHTVTAGRGEILQDHRCKCSPCSQAVSLDCTMQENYAITARWKNQVLHAPLWYSLCEWGIAIVVTLHPYSYSLNSWKLPCCFSYMAWAWLRLRSLEQKLLIRSLQGLKVGWQENCTVLGHLTFTPSQIIYTKSI